MKIYFHSAHPQQLSREFLAKAKIFIEPQLVEAEQTEPLHRVGFVILSHGAVSNWVMLDWWSSHILYHRISRVEGMPPERFIDAPLNLFQCVMSFGLLRLKAKPGERTSRRIPAPIFMPT